MLIVDTEKQNDYCIHSNIGFIICLVRLSLSLSLTYWFLTGNQKGVEKPKLVCMLFKAGV